jgi:site-specific DNA-methyltransferase (adenine-specific)
LTRVETIAEGVTLHMGDCMDILPTLAPVDAVLTDPPFGVGNFVQTTGRLMGRGTGVGKAVEWNEEAPPPEFFGILQKMSKHRIIWGANFFNCFEDRGGAIVWVKRQKMPNFSKADIASCTHFQKTEIVEIPWTNFTVAQKAETDHPCERPVDLYPWCINYLPPCKSFLDPYMGSGSVGVAAVKMGKRFVGIERDATYFDAACKRIAAATRQTDLFIEKPKPAKQEAFEL